MLANDDMDAKETHLSALVYFEIRMNLPELRLNPRTNIAAHMPLGAAGLPLWLHKPSHAYTPYTRTGVPSLAMWNLIGFYANFGLQVMGCLALRAL